MSYAPDSLIAIRQLVREKTGDKWIVSIRASYKDLPYRGYHAGYADIYGPNGLGDNASSVKRLRDRRKRNLGHVPPLASANASSACDISVRNTGMNQKLQREFTAWCVERAKAGLLDIQFVGGPDANGKPTVWSKPYWNPVAGVDKYHTHISWPRDTEFGGTLDNPLSRVDQIAPYFPA